MTVTSAEKESFWKGIAAGVLAGMTIAAILRVTPVEQLLRFLPEGRLEPAGPAAALPQQTAVGNLASMRADSEGRGRLLERAFAGEDQTFPGRIGLLPPLESAEKRDDASGLGGPQRPLPRSFHTGSAG